MIASVELPTRAFINFFYYAPVCDMVFDCIIMTPGQSGVSYARKHMNHAPLAEPQIYEAVSQCLSAWFLRVYPKRRR